VTKICVIGGGSAYMPGIAYAFAKLADHFPDTTVTLHDIDPDALDLQTRLSGSILRSRGVRGVRVDASRDRAGALEGADMVLTAFRPGGFPARQLDESIPPRYGVIGQETAGPGGFAMALRSIPVLLDIAKEVRKVGAPGAVILNYTNPVQVVTDALVRYGDVPFIGLCDQTSGEIGFLARLMGVNRGALEIDTSGTNHMTFTRAVRLDGVDVTGRVWNLLDGLDLGSLATEAERRIVRLFRVLRLIPSEYLQYFFFHDQVLAEQRSKGRTRAGEIMAQLPEVLESYRREADAADPRPSMARASEEHGDFAVEVMAAMLSGRPGRFILNVPNRGAITDLPADAVVEVPCRVMGRTIQPLAQGAMPAMVAGLVRQVVEHARLAADAAVDGEREACVRALLAHPLVRSLETAEALTEEFLTAHAAWLPQFARLS
jgi:6-phospho-beta-glucosidase